MELVGKGRHLIVDCTAVDRQTLLNDKLFLETMAEAATRAGATVISQIRYRFGSDSAPGFTAIVMLDESHVSAHAYSDLGLLAMDVFTCGNTDPEQVLAYIRERIDLGTVTERVMPRFLEKKS